MWAGGTRRRTAGSWRTGPRWATSGERGPGTGRGAQRLLPWELLWLLHRGRMLAVGWGPAPVGPHRWGDTSCWDGGPPQWGHSSVGPPRWGGCRPLGRGPAPRVVQPLVWSSPGGTMPAVGRGPAPVGPRVRFPFKDPVGAAAAGGGGGGGLRAGPVRPAGPPRPLSRRHGDPAGRRRLSHAKRPTKATGPGRAGGPLPGRGVVGVRPRRGAPIPAPAGRPVPWPVPQSHLGAGCPGSSPVPPAPPAQPSLAPWQDA